jgi:hypothetical protein
MEIDVMIDKLTPCLEEVATGTIFQTVFSLITNDDLESLQNWLFDWQDEELKRSNIYKLLIKNDDTIQGLVAAEVVRGAVYVRLIESAPHNQPPNKKYDGVGGHLFAIAVKRSFDLGYSGFVFMDAKNLKLVEHYKETLNAKLIGKPHQYRMALDEYTAKKLLEKYTLKEGQL